LSVTFTRTVDDGATVTVLFCSVRPTRWLAWWLAGMGGQYFEYTRSGVFRARASSEESYDELNARRSGCGRSAPSSLGVSL